MLTVGARWKVNRERNGEAAPFSKSLCGSVESGKIAFFGEDTMFDGFSSLLVGDCQSIESNDIQLSIK